MRITYLLDDFKRYCLYEKGIRPRTYKSIRTSLNLLQRYLKHDDLRKISTATLRSFLYTMREQRLWKPQTFRNHRTYLKLFFDWCHAIRMSPAKLVEPIEKPKLGKAIPRFLQKEDALKILKAVRFCKWHYKVEPPRNEALLATLIYTGLRIQEALNMRLVDVKLQSGELFIYGGKMRKDRIVPIHPELDSILSNYITARNQLYHNSEWLFAGVRGGQLGQQAARRICRVVGNRIGIRFTPHQLRHTFGRIATESGIGLVEVMNIMGHSSLAAAKIYQSVATATLKKTICRYDLF